MTTASTLRHRLEDLVRGRGSLRRQLIGLTAAASAVIVVVLGGLVHVLLERTTDTAVTHVIDNRAASVISDTVAASTGHAIVVPATRLDAGVAVYDATGQVVAGAVPERLREQYEKVEAEPSDGILTVADYARVRAVRFSTRDGTHGTVVVSELLAPYSAATGYALDVTIGAGLLLIAASTGLVAFASRRALAPVAAMADTAADWSEHDLGRRFDLDAPNNEITALGRTMDGLLDKVSATIRSEQRLTSELAHELRTPLTAIQGNAQLLQLNPSLDAEARADLDDILAACHRMGATIAGLIDLARNASSIAQAATCSVREVVADALAELRLDAPGDHVPIKADVSASEVWSVPQQLAVRALVPVISNAAHYAATRVLISAESRKPGHLSLLVEDDGPGIDAARRKQIFRPGQTSGQGAGLGLALSRRIARMSGGEVTLDERSELTRFRLTFPSPRPGPRSGTGNDHGTGGATSAS